MRCSRLTPSAAFHLGVEPSCILTLRDEYLTLAADPDRARIEPKRFTFDEFVARGRRRALPPCLEKAAALLHGHCHHKALLAQRFHPRRA